MSEYGKPLWLPIAPNVLFMMWQKGEIALPEQHRRNHYFALVDKEGRCVVTLPIGTTITEDGTIDGMTGAAAMWNGSPPPWCVCIEEILSPFPYKEVPTEHKNLRWQREGDD